MPDHQQHIACPARRVLELRSALVRYIRVTVSEPEAATLRVAAPEGAPSGVLPPPTLLLLRETLYQARLLQIYHVDISPHVAYQLVDLV